MLTKAKTCEWEQGYTDLTEIDWDFSDVTYRESQILTHCFHPYTAKFIPQIPRSLIKMYAPRSEDIVLDPFCGSGTTLVEAKLAGRHSIGVDTNPLAIMISKSKVSRINRNRLKKFIHWLDELKLKDVKGSHIDKIYFPDDRIWFREDVLGQIDVILRKLRRIDDFNTRNFVMVGLSSILKGISNARMDKVVPTLPRRPKYIDYKHYYRVVNNLTREINVFSRLSSRLKLMEYRLELFLSQASNAKALPYLGDARRLNELNSPFLQKGKIKLVITSPPYWSAFDYEKIHRLSVNLFKLNRKSFESEIGQENYLADMEKVYDEISCYLASRGKFCLVIGRSRRGISRQLANLGPKYGMPLHEKFIRKIKNHSFFVKGIKSEEILVFQKC